MKKLFKDIKIRILIIISVLFFSVSLFARPVVMVNSVVGNVFAIHKGNTLILGKGDYLPDLAEIITEEGAQITFSDYHDHKFHLVGSGHIKLTGNVLELLTGYIWVQSYESSITDFYIQTANAVITYKGGEAIASYDKVDGKTQLYSLNETFEIAHIMEKDFKQVVDKGQFTFIDNDFENGAPRRPTELGQMSYNKIRGLFYKIHPIERKHPLLVTAKTRPQRKKTLMRVPASVKAKANIPSEGKIIYLWPDPKVIQKKKDALLNSFYKKKLGKWSIRRPKKKFKPSYNKLSGVKIKIYGKKKSRKIASIEPQKEIKAPTSKVKTYRLPASVKTINSGDNNFENSLMNQFKQQMRHSNEVNRLIKDLKNYNQDYKTDY